MIVIPYGKTKGLDIWFRFPKPHNPDKDAEDFRFGKGEFSLKRIDAFNKHCSKLNYLSHLLFFIKMNGRKIREIRRQEPLWY